MNRIIDIWLAGRRGNLSVYLRDEPTQLWVQASSLLESMMGSARDDE